MARRYLAKLNTAGLQWPANDPSVDGALSTMAPTTHPTREKLIAITTGLLDERPIAAITLDEILSRSGVSKGSMYYHFEDFQELLEIAQVRRLSASVDLRIAEIQLAARHASHSEQLFTALEQLMLRLQSAPFKAMRMQRIQVMAMSQDNRRLQARLAAEQQRLTNAIAEQLQMAQCQGLLNDRFNPQAAAVFIQALSLGRVLDDVAQQPVDDGAWLQLVMQSLRATLA